MMASDFIINATEENFEFEVVAFSQNTPVIVDFWASWCKPCKVLSPMLERIAMELNGAFRLARVDVDKNPNLALQYSVRTLPTLKAFSSTEVVGEMVGLQPETRLVEFINRLQPPSPLMLSVEKGEGLLSMQDWKNAEGVFREVLDQSPSQPAALLGLAKSLLAQGQAHEAKYLLRDFPASPLFSQAEKILPLAETMVEHLENALPMETDQDFAFNGAVRIAMRGNLEGAVDGLLDVLRQNRQFRAGMARKLVVALLEMMDQDDPHTRQYRTELANILF